MIDRVEQVTLMHFVDFFAPMMMPDIAFWRYHLEHFASQALSPHRAPPQPGTTSRIHI